MMPRRTRTRKKTSSIFAAIVLETFAFVAITALLFQASFNRQPTQEFEALDTPAIQVKQDEPASVATTYHIAATSLDTASPAPLPQFNR